VPRSQTQGSDPCHTMPVPQAPRQVDERCLHSLLQRRHPVIIARCSRATPSPLPFSRFPPHR
jgi:hypothetical protein